MIYVCSKTRHASLWIYLRDTERLPINSTWIDEAGPGQTKDFGELWQRCITEVQAASCLLVYIEPGDILAGGLVEIGAGLAFGKKIFVGGLPEVLQLCGLKSVQRHPLINKSTTLVDASKLARTYDESCEGHSQ